MAIDDGTRDSAAPASLVAIAHDLNNILQSIRSATEVLRLQLPAGHAGNQALDLLKRNTERAAVLTAGLVDLSQDSAPAGAGGTIAPMPPASREPTSDDGLLDGLAVLVVEDESLVAMHVEDLLGQLGSRIVAMVGSVAEGVQMAAHPDLGLALLDLNLGGNKAYPIAEALEARGVPFVLMSGDSTLPERWRGRPAVQKPFELEQLRRAMQRAVRERRQAGRGRG